MQLFDATPAPSALVSKFRPRTIESFVGLDKPKRVCSKLAASPYASAWLFIGEPGLGKTTLAMALADAMPAELHHIPSQDCNVEALRRVVERCHYIPTDGRKMHMVLVDEADQMSPAAQLYLLSKLDGSAPAPNTIWVFTCNSVDRFEERFLSRCGRVDFSAYGNAKDVTAYLEGIWTSEAPADAPRPNFARIVKEATGNIRQALMVLQQELMMA